MNIRLQKVKVKEEILSDYEEPVSPGLNDTAPPEPVSPPNDDPDYNMDDDDANDDEEYRPGSEYIIKSIYLWILCLQFTHTTCL